MDTEAAAFRDDDAAFIRWVAEHPHGFVLNIQHGLSTSDARIHAANCGHITRASKAAQDIDRHVTSSYIKVCSVSVHELDDWSLAHAGGTIRRCPRCRAGRLDGTDPRQIEDSDARPSISGPVAGSYDIVRLDDEVRLTGPRYLPFEGLDREQLPARSRLRGALRSLLAGSGEILHGSYSGYRPLNSDVENILFYNIDPSGACFLSASTHGVRFEAADRTARSEPSCLYRYRVVPATAPLSHWRLQARLARFSGAELGTFPPEHRLARTWLAVHESPTEITKSPAPPGTSFGVLLELEAPHGATSGVRELVKPLIDGVVSAFQNHLDVSSVEAVAARIAARLGAEKSHIAARLLRGDRAVLGSRPRLVHVRGAGVQWNPADHLCLAGEVLRRPGDRWRLSGSIWSLEPVETSSGRPPEAASDIPIAWTC